MTPEFAFCIRFHLEKLEASAAASGIAGGDWRQQVLSDLLHDGKLRGEMRKDPKTNNDVWWLFGRRTTIVASIDQQRDDTLFVIDLYLGPEAGGRKNLAAMLDIPGPWRLATIKPQPQSPPISVQQHLYALFQPAARVPRPPRPPPPVVRMVPNRPLSSRPVPPSAPAPSTTAAPPPVASERPDPAAPTSKREPAPPPKTAPPVTPSEAAPQSWRDLWKELHTRDRPVLQDLLAASDAAAARRAKITSLEQELARLQDLLTSIPSQEDIEQIELEILEIADVAHRIGLQPMRAQDLIVRRDALELLRSFDAQRLDRIPSWAIAPQPTIWSWVAAALTGGPELADIRECADWVRETFGGSVPETLATLVAAEGDSCRKRLETAWSVEVERRNLLEQAPAHLRELLVRAPLAHARAVLERFQIARHYFHERAVEMWSAGITVGPLEQWLDQTPLPRGLEQLADDDLDFVRGIDDFERAVKLVTRLLASRGPALAPAVVVATPQPGVRFEHAVTDGQGHIVAAALLLPELKLTEQQGRLRVPLRVRVDAVPADSLVFELASPHLSHMPEAEISPRHRLIDRNGQRLLQCTIAPDRLDWHTVDSGAYVDVIVELPAYRQALDNWRLRKSTDLPVTVSLGGRESRLSFKRFVAVMPQPPRVLDATASPSELVLKRPLGVQMSHEKLERLVKAGGPSFMVVAPRRFGKTTLLKHLATAAKDCPGLFVVVVDLGRHLTAREGLRLVLEAIVSRLDAEFGSAPKIDTGAAALTADTFREIRKFLADRGRKTLALFVDEAQVLVPRQGGMAWGNTFKNLLEHHFTGHSGALADVLFVLFGTVDLSIRMGRNCRDFLRAPGYEAFDFSEDSLARYIREVSQGQIESSSVAREELARWTNNLVTLNMVLERIFQVLQDEQRTFFLDGDVRRANRELLRAGDTSSGLWSYASAELSYSDEWEPIDAFPLAVAWAREDPADRGLPLLLDACVAWLNEQLQANGFPGSITRERAEQGLADLQSRGIVRDSGEFRRQFLRELLRRDAETLLRTSANVLALQRMSVDLVEWPTDLDFQAEGGQARVFSRQVGELTRAYRICRLDGAEERKRFARTCAAIRKLRDVHTRREGDNHLPRVREAGFRADNPHEGVIVYDWVQGEALDERWTRLTAHARVFVVLQLARALDALHSRGVLHCDVHPRNVIVNGQMQAVLVDFGLARPDTSVSTTMLRGDAFMAPELAAENPMYAPPADIYALGVLLKGDGRSGLPDDISTLVERMLARDTSRRPDAREVIRVLQELSERQSFDPKQAQARAAVDAIVQESHETWILETLLLYSDAAVFFRCGYVPWDEHRVMEVAFYVNNVFSQMLKSSREPEVRGLSQLLRPSERPEQISLTSLQPRLQNAAKTPELDRLHDWAADHIHIVGRLRNAWAHPAQRKEILRSVQRDVGPRRDLLTHVEQCIALTASLIDKAADARGVIKAFFAEFVRQP